MKHITLIVGLAILLGGTDVVRAEIPADWLPPDPPPAKQSRADCIREFNEMRLSRNGVRISLTELKRMCSPESEVTNPNEYGWTCAEGRVKGHGWKRKNDMVCE